MRLSNSITRLMGRFVPSQPKKPVQHPTLFKEIVLPKGADRYHEVNPSRVRELWARAKQAETSDDQFECLRLIKRFAESHNVPLEEFDIDTKEFNELINPYLLSYVFENLIAEKFRERVGCVIEKAKPELIKREWKRAEAFAESDYDSSEQLAIIQLHIKKTGKKLEDFGIDSERFEELNKMNESRKNRANPHNSQSNFRFSYSR